MTRRIARRCTSVFSIRRNTSKIPGKNVPLERIKMNISPLNRLPDVMPQWIAVGSLADIPRLGARVVQVPAGDIAVFRTGDDEVFALRDKCPHRGEAVAPDKGCARSYPVKLEGGVVYLSLTPNPV